MNPILEQYRIFKEKHPGFCLMFKTSEDHYELFHEDATLAARTLGRMSNEREGVPVLRLPADNIENYLKKMIAAGHRCAICEPVAEQPSRLVSPEPSEEPPEEKREIHRNPLHSSINQLLKDANATYVDVDETSKALFPDGVESVFDFVIYSATGKNWILICVPQTPETITDMMEWESIFGDGFMAVFLEDGKFLDMEGIALQLPGKGTAPIAPPDAEEAPFEVDIPEEKIKQPEW